MWFTLLELPMPGLLDKKGARRFHLLSSKRWHLFQPFFSNEPSIGEDVGTKYGLDVV
jgi:hypothetical protein